MRPFIKWFLLIAAALVVWVICWIQYERFLKLEEFIESFNGNKQPKLEEFIESFNGNKQPKLEQFIETFNSNKFNGNKQPKTDLRSKASQNPTRNQKAHDRFTVYHGKKFSQEFSYLENILHDCEELCNTSRDGTEGPYFKHVTADIRCDSLFSNEDIDKGHGLEKAPKEIPAELTDYYTLNGRIAVKHWYLSTTFLGKTVMKPNWTTADIENMTALAKLGQLNGAYGRSETNALRDGLAHAPLIKDGRVLVIGSQKPWVESCVLEAGAREAVTLEYGTIMSEHPKIRTIIPSEFRSKYLNGTLGKFDGIVTFSSIEHSGLGRYGDALNPWGDILTIARAWCVTREGGSLTIGVPWTERNETLFFNAHRIYGKIRYPYLTTNWHQLYKGRGSQRVFVFTKEPIF